MERLVKRNEVTAVVNDKHRTHVLLYPLHHVLVSFCELRADIFGTVLTVPREHQAGNEQAQQESTLVPALNQLRGRLCRMYDQQ